MVPSAAARIIIIRSQLHPVVVKIVVVVIKNTWGCWGWDGERKEIDGPKSGMMIINILIRIRIWIWIATIHDITSDLDLDLDLLRQQEKEEEEGEEEVVVGVQVKNG